MTGLLLRIFVKNYKNTSDPSVHGAVGTLAGITGIVCNILLFVLKLTVGLWSGAVSIVADALNNLTDSAGSIVALLGFRLAQRPADRDHPYGHARYEYLSGVIIAALILFIGVELVKVSVQRIFAPASLIYSWATLIVLACSIGIKLWMCVFYRRLGRRIGSSTLKAAAIDSRNDVLASAAVLVGCVLGWRFHIHVDGYIGLAVALFILYSAIGVVRDTVSPLLGQRADQELIENISALVLSCDKVLGLHDLLVHDYGPGKCFASVHVELSAEEDPLVCHDIIDTIECNALKELNVDLVIHYDPVLTNDAEWQQMRLAAEAAVREVNPQLSIHDFRLVRGAKQTKLVFDLAVPYAIQDERGHLKALIDEALQKEYHQYTTVIRFDDKA